MTAPMGRHALLAIVWYGFLGAPTAWIAHLTVSYALVEPVCAAGQGAEALLHLTTAAALLASAAAGAAAFWARRRSDVLGDDPAGRRRTRFLGSAGMALAALFAAVILAEALPAALQEPCLGP